VPEDISGARDLARRGREDGRYYFEFEKWALSLIAAQPGNQSKRGADKGIDGNIYFDRTKRAIVSVKAGDNVSVAMIRDLRGVIEREGAEIGIFLTLTPPKQTMIAEAAAAGQFEVEGFAPVPRIQIVTVEEAMALRDRAVRLPLRRDDAKAAPSPRRRSRNWCRPVWTSSSSSSASISFISFCMSSSPSSVVVVGRQTSLVDSLSPSSASSAAGHLVQIGIGTPDDVALLAAFHVLGPGLDRGHHYRVGIAHIRRVAHLTLALEHERDRAGLAQVAAVLAEGRAHGRRGAVAVVGHRLDDDRHPVGPVALVADLVVVLRVAADRLVDRALDHVLGHRARLGFLHREAQARVLVGVGVAHLGGDGDLLGQLREQLGARGVLAPLAMLDIRPF
jgi:hypothetical protein